MYCITGTRKEGSGDSLQTFLALQLVLVQVLHQVYGGGILAVIIHSLRGEQEFGGVCNQQGQIQEFKGGGGPEEFSLKAFLGAICIGYKQILLKRAWIC